LRVVPLFKNNAASTNDIDSSEDESSDDKNNYEAGKKIIHDILHDDGECTDENEIENYTDLIHDTVRRINGKKNSNLPILFLIVLLLHYNHRICLGLQLILYHLLQLRHHCYHYPHLLLHHHKLYLKSLRC
jgi:hypothetical protein